MKQGFSLLELIVGLAISSIVTTLLYTTFSTILQWSDYGAVTIDTDTRIAVFLHQFEKDVTGMFLPVQAIPADDEQEKEKKPKDKKEKPKLLEKACYAEHKEARLSLFTFICNNPTRSLPTKQSTASEKKAVAGHPYISRITYTVEKTSKEKDVYTIKRQESAQLEMQTDPAKHKNIGKGYEIIDNVKSISLSFMRPKDTPEPNKAESTKKDSKKKSSETVHYESFAAWPPPQEKMVDLPHIITLTMTVWDEQQKTERSVLAHIPAFVLSQLYPIEEVDETKPKDKQEAATPPAAPNAPTPPAGAPPAPPTPPGPNRTPPEGRP